MDPAQNGSSARALRNNGHSKLKFSSTFSNKNQKEKKNHWEKKGNKKFEKKSPTGGFLIFIIVVKEKGTRKICKVGQIFVFPFGFSIITAFSLSCDDQKKKK